MKCELKGTVAKVTYKKNKMVVEGDLEVSDSYHTFDELYGHRIMLFLCLMKCNKEISWKSRIHSDGSPVWKGWFVAGMDLPTGSITYHIADQFWSMIDDIKHLETAPEWDGHTSDDVVRRLNNWGMTL